ncbi:MAG: hypothetical protein ACOC10_07570 [Bacteroidota bacterium]
MKKNFLSLIFALLTISFVSAQDNIFKLDDKVLNVGIGLGSTLYGSGYTASVPPISVSFEKCFLDGIAEKGTIGIGGYLGYTAYKWDYYDWGWKYSDFIIGPRGSFHYPLVDKLDTYTGLLMGYEILTSKEYGNYLPGYSDYTSRSGGFIWAWHAGARYYFNEQFAVMAELGYGISYLTLGLSLKL